MKTRINVSVELEVETPSVPNFIKSIGHNNSDIWIALSKFSDLELESIGKSWTDDLKSRAAEQRKSGIE